MNVKELIMEDELVSFETAKLAKEKGFINYNCLLDKWLNLNNTRVTQSLLQKWLREVHNLNINLTSGMWHKEDKHYCFRCSVIYITKTEYTIVKECLSKISEDFYVFRTFEKALEVGLQEALKLIK